MAYNDLINISFEDAVLHANTDNSDILGVIMPFYWGVAGKVNVLNQQDFYNMYPEFKRSDVTLTNVQTPYAQIKSYFTNGGSRVAVYRPAVSGELFGNDSSITGLGGTSYVAFKYPGLPPIEGTLYVGGAGTTASATVTFANGSDPDATGYVEYESFTGQLDNPNATDEGESTYLPTILANKSKYMQIVTTAPTAIQSYTPGAGSATIEGVFGSEETLTPTQFLEYNATIDGFSTSVAFTPKPGVGTITPSKFHICVDGSESVKVFGEYKTISCNAGVAGAYARVAKEVHTNQIASARSYGAFKGTLTTDIPFSTVKTNMEAGIVSVFNSSTGPQIFGTNNTNYSAKKGSYFSKCNVSRVLAAILRQIIPLALDTIHTDTAANPITRRVFETALNGVINGFISSQDLQSDSKAICDGTNNDDTQTQGGKLLNIILSLHFIGLVEKVNIRVVATDSSVTVNFA